MWTGLVGAAAAHKAAASAVGLSVLLSGTVVETTGVGPAVRESVRDAIVAESENEQPVLANTTATPTPPADATATPEAPAATETPEAVELAATLSEDDQVDSEDTQSLPGNLVTQLNPKGRFSLRAEIVSASGTVLTLATADGDLELDVAGARVHTTGAPTAEVEWSDFVGFGVFVTGSCVLPVDEVSANEELEPADVETAEVAIEDCDALEVERVRLLGRAGQGGSDGVGRPDHAGKPETLGAAADSEGPGSTEEDDTDGAESGEAQGPGRHGGNGRRPRG